MKKLGGRLVDLFTLALMAVAVYALAQPGSLPRARLAQWQSDRSTVRESRASWVAIQQVGSPAKPPAPAHLTEIADYECPFCRDVQPVVDSLLAAGIRVQYLHYPLPSHPRAVGAALSAMCAERTGHFRAMHDRLMTTKVWQRDTNWVREARAAGIVDTAAFMVCVRDPATTARLQQQRQIADRLVVTGTPMFVSTDAVHRGVGSMADLRALASEGLQSPPP